MKRAQRRYQRRVALARRVRILKVHGAWRRLWRDEWTWAPRVWREVGRQCMVEPGWWVHEMTVVPSRIRSRQQLQAIFKGSDPEGMIWPDYKSPHLYYW